MDKQVTEQTSDSRAMTIRQDDVSTGLRVLNLLDDKQLAAAESFLKRVITSEKGGIKSIPDGLAILMRAQDLHLPFSTCIEHIHVIKGKTGIDVHIIKSLLLRAGVTWDCTKDYAPQYQYTDGNTIYNETQLPTYCVKCRTSEEAKNKTTDDTVGVYPVKWYADLKGNIYNEFQVSSKCVKAINKAHALKIAQEGNFPIIRIPAQPIDYVTEYKFTRYKLVNGKERVMTAIGRFSYSEAKAAELLDKENYVKYPRIMVSHRAFTLGAREIGDDLLMGCLDTDELSEVTGVEIPTYVDSEEV